jgi:hypothetical protein
MTMSLTTMLARHTGLTVREFLSSMPHDPTAAIGYLVLTPQPDDRK